MNLNKSVFSTWMIASTVCVTASMLIPSITKGFAQLPAGSETVPSQQKDATLEAAKQPTATPDSITVKVAEGKIQFSASGSWSTIAPQSRLLEAELKIPAVEGDEQDGRLTIMGAGGTVAANIDRWKSQFITSSPEHSEETENQEEPWKTDEKTIAGQIVTFVDMSGTFIDAPGGPFSGQPQIERKNYRMLAAIIQTKKNGNYFVKFYGPTATIKQNAAAFKSMIESLQIAE